MRILMIHGRAQGGKERDKLKEIWIRTLKDGFRDARLRWPDGVEIDFPFYGDKLDQFSEQAMITTGASTKGPGGYDSEFEEFMRLALCEMKREGGISDDEVEAEMDPALLQEKGPQNWAWVQAIARVVDQRFTRASDFLIESFLKDVFLYIAKPAVTRGINSIVEEVLTDEPTIVVGHSLGSVVGYKIILDHLAAFDLRKYVTVGSPLGIKAVSSKLGVPKNPAGLNGWYNAYDERDIVALNPLDDSFFPTAPAIINDNSIDNHTENRHGLVGYLNNTEVARQIAGALG